MWLAERTEISLHPYQLACLMLIVKVNPFSLDWSLHVLCVENSRKFWITRCTRKRSQFSNLFNCYAKITCKIFSLSVVSLLLNVVLVCVMNERMNWSNILFGFSSKKRPMQLNRQSSLSLQSLGGLFELKSKWINQEPSVFLFSFVFFALHASNFHLRLTQQYVISFFLSFSRWISFFKQILSKKRKNLNCYTGFSSSNNECIQIICAIISICQCIFLVCFFSFSAKWSYLYSLSWEKQKANSSIFSWFLCPSSFSSYKTCYRYDSMTSLFKVSFSHSFTSFSERKNNKK